MRAKLNWWHYWYIIRGREQLVIRLAHALPRWLKYRVYIDVAAEVTCYPEYSKRSVPEVTMTEILSSYKIKENN